MKKPSIFICLLCMATLAAAQVPQTGLSEQLNSKPSEEKRDTVCNDERRMVVSGRFVENDTTFFLQEFNKENGKLCRSTVFFLETDRNSVWHKDLAKPILRNESQRQSIRYWLAYREKNGLPPLRQCDLQDLPADWVPLHRLQGKFYVFTPCEVDQPAQRCFTGSLLVNNRMEPDPIALQKVEKLSSALYHIELEREADDPIYVKVNHLYIHIIDPVTKAAVWEYRRHDGNEYVLLIPTESVRLFDMIVCYCPYNKFINRGCWKFDAFDAKSLIRTLSQQKM